MQRVNIAEPEFTYDAEDPEGFRSGMLRFGPALGAKTMGTSVYELPPGQSICPYHYEYAEEEWLLVLEGRPTVRHPDGADELEPWDVVCFRPGPEGAHKVTNNSAEPARVLMFSELKYPAATVYPDSGKVAVWTGNKRDDGIFRRVDAVDYYEGE
jgi:uncharacterized cupin superfamily protein